MASDKLHPQQLCIVFFIIFIFHYLLLRLIIRVSSDEPSDILSSSSGIKKNKLVGTRVAHQLQAAFRKQMRRLPSYAGLYQLSSNPICSFGSVDFDLNIFYFLQTQEKGLGVAKLKSVKPSETGKNRGEWKAMLVVWQMALSRMLFSI